MTYLPNSGGAAGFPPFTDNFDGVALVEPWLTRSLSGADKTIVLLGGRAVFEGKAGQDCSDYGPRMTMPLPYFPCEIETKLYSFNKGPRTLAGLYIGPDGQAGGASAQDCFFSQLNDASDDVIRVEGNSTVYAGPTVQATVPKWFKIRCLGSHLGAQWLFYYSTNGSSWTLFYTRTLAAALGALCAGLWVGNWYNQPLVQAQFEYFKITPYLQDGPG